MANEIGNTQLDYGIPEIWPEEALAAFYQEAQVAKRVDNVSGLVAAHGDILHLPAMPAVSVNSVGADGGVTSQQLSLTEAQLTVDKWVETTVDIIDKANIQSKVNALEGFKKAFPQALNESVETELLALYASFTSNVEGDANSAMSEDLALASLQDLLDRKFGMALRDPNRVSFILHTSQWTPCKKIAAWNDAHITGEASGGALKMSVPSLYGVPVFFNTSVASASSARQNLLILREAMALGIQRNISVEKLARTKLSQQWTAHCLYGVKVRAETRGVLIKTKA